MISIGYWYNVVAKDNSKDKKRIKIIPSQVTLESQDPSKTYYDVVTDVNDMYIINCYPFSMTLEECFKFIEENFELTDTAIASREEVCLLLKELNKDASFLKRGADKKGWEIAYHIQNAARILENLSKEVQ